MINDEIWDAGDCAAFLKHSRKRFLVQYRYLPDFPKQLAWSDGGRPRWSSAAVRAWALRQNYATEPVA